MTSLAAAFNRIHAAIPDFKSWMVDLISDHQDSAQLMIEFGFRKIDVVYPENLRRHAKVVVVEQKVPLPPFAKFGLNEFAELERVNAVGITYDDTIFVTKNHLNEITCFHEMIHIVQWKLLGIEKFLLTYGMGIVLKGYRESPLEDIAYTYQKNLEDNVLPMNFLEKTRKSAQDAWLEVNPLNFLRGQFED